MLFIVEGFDNLDPSYYANLLGFRHTYYYPLKDTSPIIGSLFPFGLSSPNPIIVSAANRNGYAAMLGLHIRPGIFSPVKKVYTGFSFSGVNDVYYSGDYNGGYAHAHCSSPYWSTDLNIAASGYVDIQFLSDPSYSGASVVCFTCRIYLVDPYFFRVRFITGANISDEYPKIAISPNIPYDGTGCCFNYFECMVCTEGAENSQGYAEFRLNGKTVYSKTDIITAPYNSYGSDVTSYLSKISAVAIDNTFHSWGSDSSGVDNSFCDYVIDDFYAGDDTGVNGGFLGPIQVKSAQSSVPSITDFETVENGSIVDDPENFVDYFGSALFASPSKYLQSPTSGSRDEILYMFDLPAGYPIYGVVQRLASRENPACSKDQTLDVVVPGVNTGSGFSDVLNKFARNVSTTFDISTFIYNHNPSTFTAWTPATVESALFGFKSIQVEQYYLSSSDVSVQSSSLITGDTSSLFDDTDSTYLSIAYGGSVTFVCPETNAFYVELRVSKVNPSYYLTSPNYSIANIYDGVGVKISPLEFGTGYFRLLSSVISFDNSQHIAVIKYAVSIPTPIRRFQILNTWYSEALYFYSLKMYAVRGGE